MLVLRIGPALAVLQSAVPAAGKAHSRSATGLLRDATGRGDITVARRPSGRPRLLPPYPELSVSMSYRDGLLLVGFDAERLVGVDVELSDPTERLDAGHLATDHFTTAEAEAVAALPPDDARDVFLRLWVAKEAALKITGRGVVDGLRAPDLSPHLAALRRDGVAIALPATGQQPRLELAVCRPAVPGLDDRPYCALARAS